jgi:sec-independent protein translocase protein TatC
LSDYSDDEIEASRAPLLDHLVELRTRLIICVAALALGFAVCFGFSKQIYIFLLHPFAIAAQLLAAENAAHAQQAQGFDLMRFFAGTRDLFLALVGAREVPASEAGDKLNLVFTAPLEFFFTKLKLAGFGAVVLTFPVLAWQIYGFVAPGLYKRERKAFVPFLLASPTLFLMGAALVYYIILPFVLWFSLSQQIVDAQVSVQLLPKVSDYLSLVTTLLLAFGLCFQLPVVLTLLGMAGIVSSDMLKSGRRYAIVAVFVVAAVVTPPDPISQTMLALPIILLYEISIWCVRAIEAARRREDEAGTDIVPV